MQELVQTRQASRGQLQCQLHGDAACGGLAQGLGTSMQSQTSLYQTINVADMTTVSMRTERRVEPSGRHLQTGSQSLFEFLVLPDEAKLGLLQTHREEVKVETSVHLITSAG